MLRQTAWLVCFGLLVSAPAFAARAPVIRFLNQYEHFWTADQVEIDGLTAGRPGNGWIREGRAFDIETSALPGSAPLFRLRFNNVHVFTTHPWLRGLILSWGGADEGVLGHLFTSSGPGRVPVYSYADPSTQHRFLTVSGEVPPAGHTEPAELIGYAYAAPTYKIGAYYFGMWSPKALDPEDLVFSAVWSHPTEETPSVATPFWSQAQQQPDDYWQGPKSLAEGYDFQNPSGVQQRFHDFRNLGTAFWSERKPVIGYYNNADVLTAQKHIKQAVQNGISYFNFYWYWNPWYNAPSINDGLDQFLAASNSNQMKFMVSVCAHGGYWRITPGNFEAATNTLVSYFERTNYLKTSNDSPIIQLCDVKAIRTEFPTELTDVDRPTLQSFLEMLRSKTFTKLKVYPTILVRKDDALTAATEDMVEGGSCVLQFEASQPDYNVHIAHVRSQLNSLRSWKPFMPCVAHNMDDRPRMGIMNGKTQETDSFNHIYQNYSEQGFVRMLEEARFWMDAQTDELASFLTIYAWNEWHEGGIIEPNVKLGATRLNNINTVFQLPQGTDPCRTTGQCDAPF